MQLEKLKMLLQQKNFEENSTNRIGKICDNLSLRKNQRIWQKINLKIL